MSRQKELSTLQSVLPPGLALVQYFRAEPRLRKQLFNILFLGLLFAVFRRGPRAYLVGLTGDSILVLPVPTPRTEPRFRTFTTRDLRRVSVKRGIIRTKVTLEAHQECIHLRVPGLTVRGEVREALTALAKFGEEVAAAPPPVPARFVAPASMATPTAQNAARPTQATSAQLARFCDRCSRAFVGDERFCPNDGRERGTLLA